jgi:hypothetical protein
MTGAAFHPYGARSISAGDGHVRRPIDKPEWLADRAAIGEQAAWWLGASL